MKKIIRFSLIFIVIIVIGLFSIYMWIENSLNQLAQVQVPSINLNATQDGEYIGSYKVFPIDVKLSVSVQANKIMDITLLKHISGQGQGAEVILDDVIEKNSIEVDVISGATYSSKVILYAISNAINGK